MKSEKPSVKPEDAPDAQEGADENKEKPSSAPKWASSESQLFAAFKLAKLAAEIGIINSDEELQFVSKLEEETPSQIAARFDTLQMVKDAGLSKKRLVTSKRGFPSLPKVASTTTDEELPFEALFMN